MRDPEFKRQRREKAQPFLVPVHHLMNRLARDSVVGIERDDGGVGLEFDRAQPQGLGLESDLHDFEQSLDGVRSQSIPILYFAME